MGLPSLIDETDLPDDFGVISPVESGIGFLPLTEQDLKGLSKDEWKDILNTEYHESNFKED